MAIARRARPLLGTLVEISWDGPAQAGADAFDVIARLQGRLSRFEADSEIARFNRMEPGDSLQVSAPTSHVLAAAAMLERASDGVFDITLGRGAQAWRLAHGILYKLQTGLELDLGGIAKGYAVDAALAMLRRAGCRWACVNAGGDLRTFGARSVALQLRNEASGGVVELGSLRDGSFATSHFAPGSRSALHGAAGDGSAVRHVSVAAPRCIWADALTKIVAATGQPQHPLVARLGAQTWLH